MKDKFNLPPLEEILRRSNREDDYEDYSPPMKGSRPTFDNHNCSIKEEKDGNGKIQTKISIYGTMLGVVCPYYMENLNLCALKKFHAHCIYYGT